MSRMWIKDNPREWMYNVPKLWLGGVWMKKIWGKVDITMNKHIACISCQFATVDESASDKRWMAYECSNPESEYHKSLLNVSPNGDKNARISWSGCDYAKRKVPLKHQEDIKAE